MTTTTDPTEREFDHPLKALPWLRGKPSSVGRDVFYTAVLCAVISVALSFADLFGTGVDGFWQRLYVNAVYSFAIGLSIHGVSELCMPLIRARLQGRTFPVRLATDLVLWSGGALIGYTIAAILLGHGLRHISTMTIAIALAVAVGAVAGLASRKQALAEFKVERERMETQRLLVTARLQVLQAQIEPHFLFNTLANVSSLIGSDPAGARKMVDELCVFLRAALDSTRRPSNNLRREVEIVEAYLSVLKVRMGERLDYAIDVPAELLEIDIPSMILQPLIENAVQHGIEPSLQGGVLRIEGRRIDDTLKLTVMDNGIGFGEQIEENVGMGTVRERLQVLYGERGGLHMARREGWTHVIVELPLNA